MLKSDTPRGKIGDNQKINICQNQEKNAAFKGGRRQHFYYRVFFDSADSVHHLVEPIAVEMNVDIVGDGRVCMTE